MNLLTELWINFWHWWYIVRLGELTRSLRDTALTLAKLTGLSINLHYIFTPLYRSYSFAGRIISFFIRSFGIIYGGIIQLAFYGLVLIVTLVYCLLPFSIIIALWISLLWK